MNNDYSFLDMIPMNGRVLIEVLLKETDEYVGILALPTSTASKEKTQYGLVKKVYKEYDGKASLLTEGDVVVFPLNTGSVFLTGTQYDDNRQEFRVIKEADLLGVIKKNDS